MPIPTFTAGYPPDGSSLGQTKSTIRNNIDGTFQTVAIDHVDNNGQPGSQPAGYHKIIHEVSQTSVATVANYNQIFSGVPGTLIVNGVTTPTIPTGGDTQLYSLTGAGVLSQLTGSSKTTNGYAWVGGILLQWGFDSFTGSQNPAPSFPVVFPNACLNIQLTILNTNTTVPAAWRLTTQPSASTSGFTSNVQASGNSTLFWFAIGY